MSRRLRGVAGALLGCLAAAAVAAAPAGAAAPAAAVPTVRHVVVVGVPGLRWSDVTATATPYLWGLAGRSSVGSASVRAAANATRRADGWLTVGAGTRARATAPGSPGAVQAAALPDLGDPAQLRRVAALNRRSTFDARVGALGGALHRAGLRTAAVGGRGAVLGAADPQGRVDVRAASVAAALPGAALVVDELPAAYRTAGPSDRAAALRAVDDGVRAATEAVGPDDLLLVLGVSDRAAGRSALAVAMARGPGFGRRWLESASTDREPFVQLIDVAPTVLAALDVAAPPRMVGRPWRATGPALPAATGPAAQRMVAISQRTRAQSAMLGWYRGALLVVVTAFALLLGELWRRGRRPRWLPTAALTVAALPVSAWLVQLTPWWEWGSWTAAPVTAAWALLLGQLARRGPWRRRPWGSAGFVGAVSALVIAVDVATGSRLQLDAPFGDNPVIAGRFHGAGNGAFAVLAAGALVAATALARATGRRRAAAVVGLVGLAAVAVDGYPGFGDDFGGVLALLPAVVVLALVLGRVRLSVPRVLATLGTGVVVAAGFALYDYSRPSAQQSHLGRFIGQLRDGTAWTIVHRKLLASTGTLTGGPYRFVVLGYLAVGALAWWLLRRHRLAVTAGEGRYAAGLAASALVLGVLGAALNDSGLLIPALGWPVVVAALAGLLSSTRSPG